MAVVHLSFVRTLGPAGTSTSGAKLTIIVPFPGTIVEVDTFLFQSPSGPVGISCSHSNTPFLPRAQDAPYLYLTNGYLPFYPREQVYGGEQVTVDMNNGDATKSITANVVMRLEG